MKTRKNLLNIVLSLTMLGSGISLIATADPIIKRAKAVQHLDNFGEYTYSGDYYDTYDFTKTGGMYGDLRKDLTSKNKPQGFYHYYDDGDNHLSTQLQKADEDPTNPNNMIYFYTRDSVEKNAALTWNREHVWCQSLSNGNWGVYEGGTDILHLRPVYDSVNSSRNNRPFADNGKGTAKVYNDTMTFGYSDRYDDYTYFEPLDTVKGDVARIIMYLWTTYTGWDGYNELNITDVIKDFDTLLKWHTMDKPDLLEGNRNDYAQNSIQKNRNPFVDHPELAWRIFGDEASFSVKNECMEAYPSADYTPIDPTGISLDKTVLNMDVGDAIQLNPTFSPEGAYAPVTWLSNNAAVASVTNYGLVTAHKTGSCTVSAIVAGDIRAECSVSVTNNNTIVKATSIKEGDVVFLTSDAVKEQFDGFSSDSTMKANGKGISYQNKPNVNGVAFDVEEGEMGGTFAFKMRTSDDSTKYLSYSQSASSSNFNSLVGLDCIEAKSSWEVEFDADGNASIRNSYDENRTVKWKRSSSYFGCYQDSSINAGYADVQLWKIDIDAYLESSTVLPTIHGSERETLVQYQTVLSFSQSNGEFTSKANNMVTLTYNGGGVTPTYGSGNTLIINKDNRFTITCTYDLAWAKFTYTSSVTDDYTFTPSASHSSGYWFAKGKSVEMLVNSDQLIISSIRFAYNKLDTLVDDMHMRFGATVSKNTWDSISKFHEIVSGLLSLSLRIR